MLNPKYLTMPIDRLAFELSSQKNPDAKHILQQVEGWQRLHSKVPTWTSKEGIEFPPRLALEQCSGEVAARYKTQVVKRLFPNKATSMVDLTGGFGVDFSFIAPFFDEAVYVERQDALCALAKHNFPLLELSNAKIVHTDGIDYLKQMQPVDLIFIDPARRSQSGKKVVFIEDCEPDVCQSLRLLLEKATYVMVKLSTMLDITASVQSLNCVKEVHVVAVGGECKDLLLILDKQVDNKNVSPQFFVNENGILLQYTREEEQGAQISYASVLKCYLYEPGAAMMKAGAFKFLGHRYGLEKLNPNTHLYTSNSLVDKFPGRAFEIKECLSFNKKDIKKLSTYGQKANLTVRNFPTTVDVLRKKLRLKEGGDVYLFATTYANNQHILIVCKKIL